MGPGSFRFGVLGSGKLRVLEGFGLTFGMIITVRIAKLTESLKAPYDPHCIVIALPRPSGEEASRLKKLNNCSCVLLKRRVGVLEIYDG